MSKLSRILRWAALPLALSMTATLAQATTTPYAGNPTSLGTLSATAPTLFEDGFLPPGVTFNDYWKFTLPGGSTGGAGGVGGVNYYFSLGSVSSTPIDLSVSIGGVTVTGPSDHFSFTGTSGTPYTLDISGTPDASGLGASYFGSIQAVPEPATWALMLAGIAVGAGVARRRLS
jgi:hypothetical protein